MQVSTSKLIRAVRPALRPRRVSSVCETCTPRRRLTTMEARLLLHKPIDQSRTGKAFSVAVLGLVLYGVYRLVSPLWVWPKPIRDELKLGMIAEKRGEFSSAEAQYRKAWEMARASASELGEEPLLHTTGIAAHLGRLLESRWRLKDAAKVYAEAFREIQEDEEASPREQVRAAALAVRYGTLAKDVDTLEWAVAELLRLANVPSVEEKSTLDQTETEIGRLKLPSHITKVDLGAAFESLGLLYLEKERHDLAVPALLQALSILSPASSDLPSRCRSALLMNALASANSSDTHSAKAWAVKSINTARDTHAEAKRANARRSTGDCRECEVAALFNLASLHEMDGEKNQAMKLYEESFALAQKWEMADGIKAGQDALDRIGVSVPLATV